jgi:hypothetical protein
MSKKKSVQKVKQAKQQLEPVNQALVNALESIKEQSERHGFGGCEAAIERKDYRVVYVCMREIGRDDLAEKLRLALHGIEDVQNG